MSTSNEASSAHSRRMESSGVAKAEIPPATVLSRKEGQLVNVQETLSHQRRRRTAGGHAGLRLFGFASASYPHVNLLPRLLHVG